MIEPATSRWLSPEKLREPITKIINVRRTRHERHCMRSKDEIISAILLWTPSHGLAKEGRPARTNIQQLCVDIDILVAMSVRDGWKEKVREIHAGSVTWWWWWLLFAFFTDHKQMISFCNYICTMNCNDIINGLVWLLYFMAHHPLWLI